MDVNSLNSDGLTALDIAVLMNNRQTAKLLLQHGALPGPQSSDNLGNYLNSLMFDAEQKLHHLAGVSESASAQALNTRASFSSIIGSTSQSCTGTETERQMGVWERRIRGLRRMVTGWQLIEIPDPPISFTIGLFRCHEKSFSFVSNAISFINVPFPPDAIGTNSVMLKILEPMDACICTKFKGEKRFRLVFNCITTQPLLSFSLSSSMVVARGFFNYYR